MRKSYFPKTVPVWAFAAVLAVAAPGAPSVHAASRSENVALLRSQLPEGETLASAPMKDLKAAVSKAIAKRPADTAEIVRIAIRARTPKKGSPPCAAVRAVVEAAMDSAKGRGREISEMAQSVAPDCAPEIESVLNGFVTGPGANATVAGAVPGTTAGDDAAAAAASPGDGFSAGFGPGFPGSPTFGGSSPSGGFALPAPLPPLPPTTPIAVTSFTNT